MEKFMSDSFVLFTKIDEVVSELTTEQKGQLFQAILDYQKNGVVPEMEKLLKLVFIPIKHDMDYCAEQREKAQQQKSEAGKKSAEARSAKSKADEERSTPLNTVEQRSTAFNTDEHNVMNCNVDVSVINNKNNTPPPPSKGDQAGVKAPEKKKQSEVIEKRFERFWSVYPKKVGKGDARKSFLKINPSEALLGKMVTAVIAASSSFQWKKDNGQYIPNPATWLNQQRWEDEVPPDMGMPDQKPAPPGRNRFANFEQRPYTDEDEAIGTAWLQKAR